MFKYFIVFGLVVSWIALVIFKDSQYFYLINPVLGGFIGLSIARILNFDKTDVDILNAQYEMYHRIKQNMKIGINDE